MGYDVVILAGQSNAEGCGIGEVEREYIPTPRIMQLDIEKKVDHKPEKAFVTFIGSPVLSVAEEKISDQGKVGNLALSFAQEYVRNGFLEEGRKLLILRCGIGGTGFKKGHWGLYDDVYLKMIEMIDYALGLEKDSKLAAFLWHQGEHDAFEKNLPSEFEKQLRDMIISVRKRYNEPELPFIAADFVHEWKNKNRADCLPIAEKIKAVIETVGSSGFVNTEGLLSNNEKEGNGDDIHFCRQSLYELGKRYFYAYREILRKSDHESI